eukprot:746725-Hanusia_phi.AAC.2
MRRCLLESVGVVRQALFPDASPTQLLILIPSKRPDLVARHHSPVRSRPSRCKDARSKKAPTGHLPDLPRELRDPEEVGLVLKVPVS